MDQKPDNSHVKWFVAATVGIYAGLAAAAVTLPSHEAKIYCAIAAAALTGFLGQLSPGIQRPAPAIPPEEK